ncbi:hypothetical protein WR25_06721 [Diploscapter pachys]|uniref:Uncharacterized protein n=1 Tax=Diploscapter pachys TaxID=2018661 RepID=A0A2A2M1E0_9BILA|nr:hypothetical protein WR25_06721 [Diploscapter pachys]
MQTSILEVAFGQPIQSANGQVNSGRSQPQPQAGLYPAAVESTRSHSRSTDITDVSSDSIPSNHIQQPASTPTVAQSPAGQPNQQGGGLPQVQTLRSALQQVSNSHESQQQFSNFNRAGKYEYSMLKLLPDLLFTPFVHDIILK